MSDLRIYYGDARIILPAGDPRIASVLSLVVRDVQVEATPTAVPRNDVEFLSVAERYFARRRCEK